MKPTLHDERMRDENERKTFHEAYGRLADTIDTRLRVIFHLVHETEEAINASGDDIHTGALMLLFDFAEAIDAVSVLVRSGSARNCCQLLRTALEIGLSLQYIAQDKATYNHRALAYEYYHRLDELGRAQKCDPDHERGKQLRAELKGVNCAPETRPRNGHPYGRACGPRPRVRHWCSNSAGVR